MSAAAVHVVPIAATLAIAALIPAAIIDVRERRLPDIWVGAALAVLLVTAMVGWATGTDPAVGGAVVGALVAAGPILVLHLLSPAAMGFGDVKAAAVIGLALGSVDWRLALVALTLAAGAAGVAGVASRARTIAFGPFLVLGAAVALCFTDVWLDPMRSAGGLG